MNASRIAILGTGYVGLVVGACLAKVGHPVVCIDNDKDRIRALRNGDIPFYEPGLEALVREGCAQGRLTFCDDIHVINEAYGILMIVVGTPQTHRNAPDLSQMENAAAMIAEVLDHEALIVVKSTVPVGTTYKVAERIRRGGRTDTHFAYNPEFLSEGRAVEDFLKPSRTVIGGDDPLAIEVLTKLYAPFASERAPVLVMDIPSAEMSKYAANVMLASRLSVMNQIALLCDRLGADVEAVKGAVGLDPRIGSSYLDPGIGFGGSCLPKDLRALTHSADACRVNADLLRAILAVNAEMRSLMAERIRTHFEGRLQERRLAVWGVTFKAETDDVRESPAVALVNRLAEEGAECHVYDRVGLIGNRPNPCPAACVHPDPYSACDGAEALLVLTPWADYVDPDWAEVRRRMHAPVIFDGRNLYEPDAMRRRGFLHYAVGRPA